MPGERMTEFSRRHFLLCASSSALVYGCASPPRTLGTAPAAPAIRAPSVGQSWRYAKQDRFTREVIDIQVDRIATITSTIVVNSHTESTIAAEGATVPQGGLQKLRHYFDHPKAGATLPDELQSTWGMIQVDPHWGRVQVYDTPVPLWPAELRSGAQTRIRTTYTDADAGTGLDWNQTMKVHGWETVTVAAGRFTALRYTNWIDFTDSDPARTGSVRRETVWFAPEVGRWIARECGGSYFLEDSVIDQPYLENSFRWELLAWS